jgi:cyclophilin family peptidyl-prolyl cis-trans isomerase
VIELNLKTARSFDELADHMMKNQREYIRVTAGFQMQGRKPAEIGDELQVSRSFAAELVSAGKAERIPPRAAAPPADLIPQIQSPTETPPAVDAPARPRRAP